MRKNKRIENNRERSRIKNTKEGKKKNVEMIERNNDRNYVYFAVTLISL